MEQDKVLHAKELADWRMNKIEERVMCNEKDIVDHGNRLIAVEKDMEVEEERSKDIKAALTSQNNWVRGIFGSVFIAIVLLIIDLLTGHGSWVKVTHP